MDEHMDRPAPSATTSRSIAQLIWPPLLVLVVGLVVTSFAAQTLDQQSRSLSQRLFQFQHEAVISSVQAIHLHPPGTSHFSSMFADQIPDTLSVSIHTLERHTKEPVLEVANARQPLPASALRSEVSAGGRQWMVTSIPDHTLFEQPARHASWIAWMSGITTSAIAALLCGYLSFRWQRQRTQTVNLAQQNQSGSRQLESLQVEKTVLRQALNESEQRSRDLVVLSGSTICEVDENYDLGYVSPRIVDLLRVAPADVSGTPVASLVIEAYRDNFERTLASAREEHQMQRIDLELKDASGQPVPVTLRILALQDTLHGFSGFRLSLQARGDREK